MDEYGKLVEGEWRSRISDVSDRTMFHSDLESHRGRQSDVGKRIRDYLKAYLNSPEGAVEWQRRAVYLE